MRGGVSKIAIIALVGVMAAKIGGFDANAASEEEVVAEAVDVPVAEADEGPARVLPEMLAVIAAERKAMEEKRVALATREADLELIEDSVTKQMAELGALRDELSRLLETANMRHDEDLGRLVSIYTSMKPAQAGQIIGTMDLEVATLVIAQMQERQSGPILAAMDIQRAQVISKIIYERSKLPGDQREIVVPRGG